MTSKKFNKNTQNNIIGKKIKKEVDAQNNIPSKIPTSSMNILSDDDKVNNGLFYRKQENTI